MYFTLRSEEDSKSPKPLEGSLLLRLSTCESTSDAIPTLESALDHGITPEEFCTTAIVHDLGPLVYHALGQLQQDGLQGKLALWVRRSICILRPGAYQASVASHAASLELSCLVAAAEREGIRPVLIKGLSLAAHLPREDARIFGDLDLLVQEESIAAMVDIAFDCGYVYGEWLHAREGITPWIYSKEEIALTWRNDKKHIPCLIVPDSADEPFPKTLEIHRNVVRPSCQDHFDLCGAVKRARKGSGICRTVRTLDTADALWAQALHMYQSPENIALALSGGDLKLAWFRDTKALLASEGVAETLIGRVEHPEAQYACAVAILNTEDLYPGTIDEATHKAWSDPFDRKPGNQLFEDLNEEGLRTNMRGRRVGEWSRDICDRIFDERRLTEILPHWWSLGSKARRSPYVCAAKERMCRLGLPWSGATGEVEVQPLIV